MTTATPKPRAGEHMGKSVDELLIDRARSAEAERDSLAAQNRELREALASIDQLMMSMPLTSKIEHQVHGIAHRALTKVRPAS